MNLHRMPAPRWMWTVAALILVMVALSPLPADARQYKTINRISVSSSGVQGINIQDPTISANGNFVVFWSDKEGLVPGDTNFAGDVFLRNLTNNQTYRVSLGHGGVQTARADTNLPNSYPDTDISDDGCIVVYSSDAHNITQVNGSHVPDVNNTTDVFAIDMCIGGFPTNAFQTLHVSRNYGSGQQANGGNTNPKVSGDGRFVVWRSGANNLVTGDTNNAPDIFLMDRHQAGVFPISRVNISDGEAQANIEDGTQTFDINFDGNIIAFASIATNLVGGDTNGVGDIFVRNRAAGSTVRINGVGGAQPNGPSFNPVVSGNGQFVAFRSNASNLVAGDNNGHGDIFIYNTGTGAVKLISVSSEGTQANFPSDRPAINSNGRFVSFYSDATSLVYGDTNGSGDIFVHDRVTDITTRVSVRQNGEQGNGPSGQVSSLSDNRIAWESYQDNIVDLDTNATSDVFLSEGGPASPNKLTLVSKTSASATISWTNNGSYSDVIIQRRKEGNANFGNRETLGGGATSYNDPSLAACTVYFYRVMGVANGIQSPSNILRVKTLGCPPGPFNLTNPVNNEAVINPERLDFRWTPSEEAVTYTFTLNRAGTGQVEQRVLNAGTICDATRCIVPIDGALLADLINGNFTWTVAATNPIATTPATNNAQGLFVVNDTLPPRAFPLTTPAQGSLVRNPDTFAGFVWRDNRDADSYALTVIQVSNNVRLGTIIDQQNLSPESDGDGLACNFDTRICTYMPTGAEIDAMANGRYTWTVAAESPGGTRTEAENGALKFRVNTGDIELLLNGGFETDANLDKVPDNWTLGNGTKDARKCNKPGKTFTPFGNCAFRFKSSPTERSTLTQVITDGGYGLTAVDDVRFSGMAEASNLAGSVKVKVMIKYANGQPKGKATATLPAGTYPYAAIQQLDLGVDGPVANIKVKIVHRATAGKLLLDQFSLKLLGPNTPRTLSDGEQQYHPNTRIPLDQPRDGGGNELLPPPPPAVDGFRGQN